MKILFRTFLFSPKSHTFLRCKMKNLIWTFSISIYENSKTSWTFFSFCILWKTSIGLFLLWERTFFNHQRFFIHFGFSGKWRGLWILWFWHIFNRIFWSNRERFWSKSLCVWKLRPWSFTRTRIRIHTMHSLLSNRSWFVPIPMRVKVEALASHAQEFVSISWTVGHVDPLHLNIQVGSRFD